MVGLVIVSHSAKLAEGVAELAAQMAGPDVRIGAAGGLDEPAGTLGTDAAKVVRAIEEVWSPDGVLVLMDLGSAVLSAELAVDLLDEERRAAVLLTEAPLVEGAVAAAVAAGVGDPLEAVAAAARAGLAGKEEHLAPGRDGERDPGSLERSGEPGRRDSECRSRRTWTHGRDDPGDGAQRPGPPRTSGRAAGAHRGRVRRRRDRRRRDQRARTRQRAEPERSGHPRRPPGRRAARRGRGTRGAGGAGGDPPARG